MLWKVKRWMTLLKLGTQALAFWIWARNNLWRIGVRMLVRPHNTYHVALGPRIFLSFVWRVKRREARLDGQPSLACWLIYITQSVVNFWPSRLLYNEFGRLMASYMFLRRFSKVFLTRQLFLFVDYAIHMVWQVLHLHEDTGRNPFFRWVVSDSLMFIIFEKLNARRWVQN